MSIELLVLHHHTPSVTKREFLEALHHTLQAQGYVLHTAHTLSEALHSLEENPRVMALLIADTVDFSQLPEWFDALPLFVFADEGSVLEAQLAGSSFNLDFLTDTIDAIPDYCTRIANAIESYHQTLLPPFTRALMRYVQQNKYAFCTPGHLGGAGFQNSPSGALFYDFFGPNIFKADVSISMPELGSLLDHSGPHREAEENAAKVFGADRTLFSINGTSTSNKIVGMYAVGEGDTMLVDRNCHKSIAHFMMMTNVTPIYLKPTRNAYGILGGIPYAEFSKEAIQAKINASTLPATWPRHMVVTNSTYDGLLYNMQHIATQTKDIQHLHFDSAWVPYTAFHPIYANKFGLSITPEPDQTIFETQSTHKLLAAFSQASMIHVKGKFDEEVLNEAYMMHTSTSPFYPIVASCEISTAMMQGKRGRHLMEKTLKRAYQFRQEIKRLKGSHQDWYYDVWQPEQIDTLDCWELKPHEVWHGFAKEDMGHLFLDPLKITLLLPGLKQGQFETLGIPAAIVSMYLDEHGIIVEKTGPYSMLFLFSIGINDAKAMRLLNVLNQFKRDFDQNLSVKEMLPELYQTHPKVYASMTIQALAEQLHQQLVQHNLPEIMNTAFDVLPEVTLTPHQAYQQLIKGNTHTVRLRDMTDQISAVMLLPYPPGVPLIMPGERVTLASRAALDYLILLEDIGRALPGFEACIHGTSIDEAGYFTVKCINRSID